MRLSYLLQSHQKQGLMVELSRVSLYALILLISVISSIAQEGFTNWAILGPFYTIITIGISLHAIYFAKWEWLLRRPVLFFLGFVIDSVLISALIYFSGINQSLFLFLHLVNILLAGIATGSAGAIALALCTSISFSVAAIFSPELKALNFFFLLALNNVAFFSVAALGGYLSQQLQIVGSELKEAGQSLRTAEELNEIMIENIPSGMVSFDSKGTVLKANKAALEILGLEELLEKNWFDVFPSISDVKGSLREDLKYQSPSGEAKILEMKVSSVTALNEGLSVAIFDDLTKIRQLEFSARQNEKLAAIGGLAAGIAHEIRNPLAGISGSIELLSQTVNNDDDRRLMKIILREIDRLNNLITEFLDYSRPEEPPTDPVNISDLLLEVLEGIKTNTQVRLETEQVLHIDQGLVILGKRDKLKQAFLNIILNSYQAMNESATPAITVSALVVDESVQVRIKDAGSGMSENTRKRLFEPFHTTKAKGTGLGLAVTHKILEGHYAQVFVESEVGVGTEFVLTFPKAR